ncbi:MAG: hypothetical protein ACXWKY_16480, partial [Caulobacteraceae bacterium]
AEAGMLRDNFKALWCAVVGIWGLLATLLVFTYWLMTPSDMWTGGRPELVGVFMVIGCMSAWALYWGAKRLKP